jgi:hypothetical protein
MDAALARFDRERTEESARIQRLGVTMGDQMINDTPDWTGLTSDGMAEWFRQHSGSARWYATARGA